MISNKTAVTLFLITLATNTVVSSSSDSIQGPSTPSRFALIKRQGRTPRMGGTASKLQDMTGTVEDVQLINNQIKTKDSLLQRFRIWKGKSKIENLERLIKRKKYEEIVEVGERMSNKPDKFLKRLCLVIKTFEQYEGLAGYLKRRIWVGKFYVQGDMGVVKKIIVESKAYEELSYSQKGDLEEALPLALKRDCHDRVIEFLNIRKQITTEKDEQDKQSGRATSFGQFVSSFLDDLLPWGDSTALKRFLTLRADELRDEYPDILDTLCEKLVNHLSVRSYNLTAKKLLSDLIGQQSLLTTVPFVKGFLCKDNGKACSDFIVYGWREAIEEGLKEEHPVGGEHLWRAMRGVYPDQTTMDYPPTPDALAAILTKFPTKQQKEEQWIRKNVPGFLETVEQTFADIFPIVLVRIVIEYVKLSWLDVPSIKSQ